MHDLNEDDGMPDDNVGIAITGIDNSNGNWEYDITELGFKYNMTDVSASFGIWQLDKLKSWELKRAKIFSKYTEGLRHLDGVILPKYNDEHSKHLFVIKLYLLNSKILRKVTH